MCDKKITFFKKNLYFLSQFTVNAKEVLQVNLQKYCQIIFLRFWHF